MGAAQEFDEFDALPEIAVRRRNHIAELFMIFRVAIQLALMLAILCCLPRRWDVAAVGLLVMVGVIERRPLWLWHVFTILVPPSMIH